MPDYKIETLCVQAGYDPKNGDPRVLPIYASTTYKYDSASNSFIYYTGAWDFVVARHKDGSDTYSYYATVLEVSGKGIEAELDDGSGKGTREWVVAVESFKNGEQPTFDGGYYDNIDFSNLNVGDIVNSLKGVLEFVGTFPLVIGAIFSFMPAWLQTLFIVGVGAGVVLFVWKVIT